MGISPLVTLFFFLLTNVYAGYDPNAKNNVAAYWGQGANQERLGNYCKNGIMDIAVISFLTIVTPTNIAFNFGNACWGDECPLIAEDIKYCQSMGIKILISMGGDMGMSNFNLESNSGGEAAAQLLYEMFNVNSNAAVKRPFGDAQIDGFDLDVENNKQTGQIAFINKLKALWGEDNLLISACPQCLHPDNNVGLAIDAGVVDIVFMQFYSNVPCSINLTPQDFTNSWNTWMSVCDTVLATYNKQIKFFVTLQVQEDDGWHANLSYITQQMLDKKSSKYLAGFGAWDAVGGSAYSDNTLGQSMVYIEALKLIISGVFDSQFAKRDEL